MWARFKCSVSPEICTVLVDEATRGRQLHCFSAPKQGTASARRAMTEMRTVRRMDHGSWPNEAMGRCLCFLEADWSFEIAGDSPKSKEKRALSDFFLPASLKRQKRLAKKVPSASVPEGLPQEIPPVSLKPSRGKGDSAMVIVLVWASSMKCAAMFDFILLRGLMSSGAITELGLSVLSYHPHLRVFDTVWDGLGAQALPTAAVVDATPLSTVEQGCQWSSVHVTQVTVAYISSYCISSFCFRVVEMGEHGQRKDAVGSTSPGVNLMEVTLVLATSALNVFLVFSQEFQ